MERIFLIGYMGCGKSTIGKRLAQSLSLSFIDLDAHIQNKYRKSIAELFAGKGEEEFRRIERQALLEVATFEDVLISTGGGAPCFFDNMEVMNRAGITIYIQAKPEELAARLRASKTVRPLLREKKPEELVPFIREHLAERERYYKKAQIIFPTDHMITKEEIQLTVDAIAERLKNRNR
ncbi:MAG: shikimate kinase [Proteiniphilum sp.]|jgi:shikimate kinase|nr:shikimate kinase [Proteiniphilum sp.]